MPKPKREVIANRSLTKARIVRDQLAKSIEEVYAIAVLADSASVPKENLLVRVQNLETLLSRFHKEQDAILDILIDLDRADEFSADMIVFERVEKSYYDTQVIVSCLPQVVSPQKSVPEPPNSSVCALPKIDLPKFDGSLLTWRSFRDTFVSLIHNNQGIGKLEKFHYLLTCVSGPALTIVKSLPLSVANYDIAWVALMERYDNQRLLATAHLDQLFAFRPMNTESLSSLLAFITVFQENVSAIKALGVVDLAGFILFFMGVRVLDPVTRHLFESEVSQDAIPTFDVLLKFVQRRCKILENINGAEISDKRNIKTRSMPASRSALTIATQSQNAVVTTRSRSEPNRDTRAQPRCSFCDDNHAIYRCQFFKKLTIAKRREFVSSNKLCFSCMSSSHLLAACPSKYRCKTCGERHNTILHSGVDPEVSKPCESPSLDVISDPSNSVQQSSQFSGTVRRVSTVLLGTAILRVRDRKGNFQAVRALLDSGSQVSAITVNCAARLGLDRRRCRTEIVGLAQSPVNQVQGVTSCSFVPHHISDLHINCDDLIVLPRITAPMPATPLPSSVRQRYRHLNLADPQFDVPAPIDMLIGGDVFPYIIRSKGEVIHTLGFPSAIETLLGWVFVGSMSEFKGSTRPLTSMSVSLEPPVEALLRQFWSVEEPVPSAIPTTEDQICERWFNQTTFRDNSGRFVVALPFRDVASIYHNAFPTETSSTVVFNSNSHGLGDSRNVALKRLYNLESRLAKDIKLYDAYRTFMEDYLTLGHMKIATCSGKFFIPHHAIVKRDGDISKLRVVFDASSMSSSGVSLNDVLYTGPKLQTDISDILLKCRLSRFVFTADIAKMYRQIRVRSEDCAYQHIFWRHSPEHEVQEYELLTVTYGVNAAPFLAIRCLHALDSIAEHRFPAAKGILTDKTYVDDIVVGADDEGELERVQDHLIGLLGSAGCVLKKWASNSRKILERIPLEDHAQLPSFDPKDTPSIKVLGLHWDPYSDAFGYHTHIQCDRLTKRGVLSIIARLFDPIGALGPMILWAKSFMQQLWIDKFGWDTPLSPQLCASWEQFISELPSLSSISLPRHIDIRDHHEIQLLGFADASQAGYAATTFLHIKYVNREIRVYPLTCKTKVAPLNSNQAGPKLSIPRLELCAVLLLAQLLRRLHTSLSSIVNISRVCAWTDSSIVLSWLTADQTIFKAFITNRVAKIHSLAPTCKWSHVSTSENPADPSSRGLLPKAMVLCRLHWNGPDFIHLSADKWPRSVFTSLSPDQLPDIKTIKLTSLATSTVPAMDHFLTRFSSLTRLQRSFAYALRFVYSRFLKQPISEGPLSCAEISRAMRVLTRVTQRTYFAELFQQLSTPGTIITPATVAQLAPFIDEGGLIRVGGRLRGSSLGRDTKHPYLLPKSSQLTVLLIQNYHLTFLHAGPKLVLSMLRQRFWIISGRDAVRKGIFTCVTCARYKAIHPKPLMGDLPPARVQPHRPFLQVGMDFGGPFYVKESRCRSTKTVKAYLALFVCMAVKAVHIELVSDLTSDAFLAALDRFVARRGIPSDFYTDCGTNYVGAARQLKLLFNEKSTQTNVSAHVPCKWHFNPPAAPHFGGLWEAAIKRVKFHVRHVIGSQTLTFEEFLTLATRIEGILNSRPLTPLSTDPHDTSALTPGHFLIGEPIHALPETDVEHTTMNRLTRWELIRQCHQTFWKRWAREYLTSLQRRQKWFKEQINLKVGDLVIVEAPNCPPSNWRLGRILDIHPGPDQVVRVVTVRTSEGVFKRPVVKLVKLPVDD